MSTELTKLDDQLLFYASQGLSALEISEQTNIPAEVAVTRIREILKARDIWSHIEQLQLTTHELQTLKSQLQVKVQATNFSPKDVENLLKTIQMVQDTAEKVSTLTEKQIDALAAKQTQLFLQLIQDSYDLAKRRLIQDYPEINIETINQIFNDALATQMTLTTGENLDD